MSRGRDLLLVFAGAAAGLLLAVGLGVILVFFGTFSKAHGDWSDYGRGLSFEEPTVSAPLAKMRVTKAWGTTSEIFATLAPGVPLDEAVDIGLFEGFEPGMDVETARARHGPPTGKWVDPYYRVVAPYYDRPDGRISLCRVNLWNTVGYPKMATHEAIFRDRRLLEQLLPLLPRYGGVEVHVLRQNGWGGVSVRMTTTACLDLVLSARDE